MGLNRMGKAADNKMEPNVIQENTDDPNKSFDYEAERKKIEVNLNNVPPSVIDSSIDSDEDKGPVFLLDEDADTEIPNAIQHPSSKFSENGLVPANEIDAPRQTAGSSTAGYDVVDTARINASQPNQIRPAKARPATDVDIENLDESMILNIPQIKAASFEVLDILNPKPKDKTLRFRWANYKNAVQGNLSKYYSLGFRNAEPSDIDETQYKLDPSMIDGSTIKYYDVILLKIPVIRLMELYKANILKSANRLIQHQKRGVKEALREFTEGLTGKDRAGYNRTKDAIGKDPVEFFTPGAEESEVVGK